MGPHCAHALLLTSLAGPLSAEIHTVGGADGDFDSLPVAIESAQDGDTVLVRPGEYILLSTITLHEKSLEIRSEAGPESTLIRLSALPSESRPYHYSLFAFFGESKGLLEGFTLSGGRGIELSVAKGGAIYCAMDSAPTIRNCKIVGNQGEGGGIYCGDDSAPLIVGCEFRGNESRFGGGGLFCANRSRAIVKDCVFLENLADGGGGAVCHDESAPIFEDCSFRRNSARLGGGLSFSLATRAVVRRCTFENNAATSHGGGVYADTSMCLELCDIIGNFAPNGGGIAIAGPHQSLPAPLLLGSRIHGNSARNGGGIWAAGSRGEVVSCMVTGNFASREGGGIWLDQESSRRLRNLTIVANHAEVGGGSLACVRRVSGSPVTGSVSDSILWKNLPVAADCIFAENSLVEVDPLFLQDVSPDFESFTTVEIAGEPRQIPAFLPLTDFAPGTSSPAIDGGPETGGTTIDLLGRDRTCAGRPDLGALEAGACEAPRDLFVRGDANQDGTIDISDAVVSLGYLFLGDAVDCLDAVDYDDDGRLDLGDPIGTLYYLFREGASAAFPAGRCGVDLTADELGCSFFAPCST